MSTANTPACSVIISVYKNTAALAIILKGYAKQSETNFEIVIAEDKQGQDMIDCIQQAKNKYKLTIKHISHPDDGFRKCAILNKAIAICAAPYIIFTDGDCVPHRHFVQQHLHSAQIGKATFARRVMLSQSFTEQLYSNSNALFNWQLWPKLLFTACTEIIAGIYLPWLAPKNKTGIWGCNWAVHKQAMLDIGGFDEDYNLAGYGEDRDVEWRLLRHGLHSQQIKHRAIQYHLWHKVNYENTTVMQQVMMQKMKAVTPIAARQGDAQLRELENIFAHLY
jgi:glycosyltransferase involved in cell wall biosynthesis